MRGTGYARWVHEAAGESTDPEVQPSPGEAPAASHGAGLRPGGAPAAVHTHAGRGTEEDGKDHGGVAGEGDKGAYCSL